jgi:hypothetical protein
VDAGGGIDGGGKVAVSAQADDAIAVRARARTEADAGAELDSATLSAALLIGVDFAADAGLF